MSLLPVAEAQARLLDSAAPIHRVESVPLDMAEGRVLAKDLTARLTQPPFDASAMDGYALRFDDAAMPANDHRLADGLSIGEVVAMVRRAITTGQAIGINVTIFNPDLDWDGSVARRIVDMLTAALQPASSLRRAGNQ